MRRLGLFAWILFGCCAPLLTDYSRADTIFLKNGSQITAQNAREEGGKVVYESAGGAVSIPKSLVDHIDKNEIASPSGRGEVSKQSFASAGAVAKELVGQVQMTQKDVDGIIGGGAVNEERLKAIAAAADRGDAERQKAVNSYLVAATFEGVKGRFSIASHWVEEALRLSPHDVNALLLAAQLDIAQQRYHDALDRLWMAQGIVHDSPEILETMGYAYYFTDGPEKALTYWKQAETLRPNPVLKQRIAQLERESAVESKLEQVQSGQFILNWEGSRISGSLGPEVLSALESDYSELEASFDASPREAITVILYGSEQFRDITQPPTWSAALNDGKIRVPVQGLTSMTPDLGRILKHELAHSFVFYIAGEHCPTWLNEGLAQLMAGERLDRFGNLLPMVATQARLIPLQRLEGSFMQLSGDLAALAYAESLGAAELIREQFGDYEFPALLKALGEGETMAEAMQQVLHLRYEDLDASLTEYAVRQSKR